MHAAEMGTRLSSDATQYSQGRITMLQAAAQAAAMSLGSFDTRQMAAPLLHGMIREGAKGLETTFQRVLTLYAGACRCGSA